MAETLPAIRSIDDLNRYADIMMKSGFFQDVKSAAQACVKIMAGQEIGIPPIASMRGIYIVKGQVSMSSQIMAALIKRSATYDYRVVETTNHQCSIQFFENGEPCGESTYSIDDAKVAKLSGGDTWQKHPKMMLFNRAMSNGAKMFCPDIFHGSPYVEGEVEESIVDEDVKDIPDMTSDPPPMPRMEASPSEKQLGMLRGELKRLGIKDGDKRRLITHIYGENFTSSQCSKLISMLKPAETLPKDVFRHYVKMLSIDHPWYDALALQTKWKKMFGDTPAELLTLAQQGQYIDWLLMTPEDEPTVDGESKALVEASDDVLDLSAVMLEPPSPWLAEITRIQNETKESLEEIEAWLLRVFGRGAYNTVEEMPVEWIEAVQKMDASAIKTSMDGATLV